VATESLTESRKKFRKSAFGRLFFFKCRYN
jgi:hypothetical protein